MTDRNQTQLPGARIKELKPLSFIYEIAGALKPDICHEAIRRFEEKADQQNTGRIGGGQAEESAVKKTTDIFISGRDDWRDIDGLLRQSLAGGLREVAMMYPFFGVNRFKDIGYNLQRYRPGEYYHWHVDSGPGEFMARQLVALWYLNDVAGPGGETEFALQDVKVTPQEGKLVLFPPFWTHIHRAATVEQGVKYIATTWVCFA
ncbi:MAG: 2OG-Fe(II) oxygenase [Gammaproteobacteria bacterium]|nr:2OG-Fe(II) oxygenase [Gammaproteobacteria bacterium]